MKIICLVAHDMAPSECFKRLAVALEESGFIVILFAGYGRPFPQSDDELRRAVQKSDLLVLGMSSSAVFAESEIKAGTFAQETGVPYGFYGDIAGTWLRARDGAWFHPLAEGAQFYFGFDDYDAHCAHEVFTHAKGFGTGNPLRELMAFPKLSRKAVREKLGIKSGERLILAPGIKTIFANLTIWSLLAEAVPNYKRYRCTVIMCPHPGDPMLRAVDKGSGRQLTPYEDLAALYPKHLRVVRKEEMSSSDMLPGADLVVEFASSVGIEAAYQRIPLISITTESMYKLIEKESGNRWVESHDTGVALKIGPDVPELRGMMHKLLDTHSAQARDLRLKQRECYPKPKRVGVAIERMTAAVQQLVV